MNQRRRALLRSAQEHLEKAETIIQMAVDQEQDAMDSLPENLQGSEQYEKMESAVDSLEAALDHINDAKESLEDAVL